MTCNADRQVESLMSKLAIEKRVQYGAEKMLDVSCFHPAKADIRSSRSERGMSRSRSSSASPHS